MSHAGARWRLTPAVAVFRGRFGGYAESVRSSTGLQREGRRDRVANRAWEATGVWVFTGEPASDRDLVPSRPLHRGGWGALQANARHARVVLGDEAQMRTLAAAGTSRVAEATSVGLAWFPNHLVRVIAAYDHTTFGPLGASPRPTERALTVRYHVAF